MPQQKDTLLVGTSKGLVIYKKIAGQWQLVKSHFIGMPVSVVHADQQGHWWAALPHRHWGQKLHFSTDQGHSWQEITAPVYPADAYFQPGKKASLRKIWCMADQQLDDQQHLFIGTEPGGLFRQNQTGQTFELVESLWNHPSRQTQWFGAGRDEPFIHSIVIDPRDPKHMYIAVSCAGVFETLDGGLNWRARNKGLKAAYLPNPDVEVGHDPHLLLACHANPDVLWQQNHCGIFRSTDGGAFWEDISGRSGFPYYGFALAIDHQNPERAWVIPADSDERRVAVDQALCVCVTEDGGKSWRSLRKGLPQQNCFDIVFRHGMDINQQTLAFGTTTGNLFLSEDYGESWLCLSHHLARIDALRFV